MYEGMHEKIKMKIKHVRFMKMSELKYHYVRFVNLKLKTVKKMFVYM
jgi:hypothetical protein